jgi:hypothetical protein
MGAPYEGLSGEGRETMSTEENKATAYRLYEEVRSQHHPEATSGYRFERTARIERTARKAKGKCEHRGYPLVVDLQGGGRRALCLGCGAAGPVREDTHEAREALLGTSDT